MDKNFSTKYLFVNLDEEVFWNLFNFMTNHFEMDCILFEAFNKIRISKTTK